MATTVFRTIRCHRHLAITYGIPHYCGYPGITKLCYRYHEAVYYPSLSESRLPVAKLQTDICSRQNLSKGALCDHRTINIHYLDSFHK